MSHEYQEYQYPRNNTLNVLVGMVIGGYKLYRGMQDTIAGLEAFVAASESGSGRYLPVLALFDHEEVGSQSDHGAQSELLLTVLERITLAAGGTLALIHAFFSIHLRADQIVSGTAINFLALGVTGYFFIDVYGDQGTPGEVPSVPTVTLPVIKDLVTDDTSLYVAAEGGGGGCFDGTMAAWVSDACAEYLAVP